MHILRLINGEFRKIFLKPGIFIMTGLLILVLTISPKLFSPQDRDDYITSAAVGTATNIKLDNFTNGIKGSSEQPETLLYDIDQTKQEIDFLLSISSNNPVTELKNYVYSEVAGQEGISVLFRDYVSSITFGDGYNSKNYNLRAKANVLKERFKQLVEDQELCQILITQEAYEEIMKSLGGLIETLNAAYDGSLQAHIDATYRINQKKYISTIKKYLEGIKNLTYSNNDLNSLIAYFYTPTVAATTGKLAVIEKDMTDWEATLEGNAKTASKNLAKMDNYVLEYMYTAQNCVNLLRYGTYKAITKTYSDVEISQYKGFENFSSYQNNETFTKCEYMFDHDTIITDYGNVFAFNANSTKSTNCFDFIYFVLEIMSFVIIAYGVFLGASMISSEQTNGTMKMLAVRPYKRGKIMFAKIFATMFFVTVFILLTALIAFIIGLLIYKGATLPVLAVFNGTRAFVISPVLLLFIYLVSLWLKIFIFVLIAFAISTIFKSYAGAVIISILIYVLTLIITFVAKGADWLKYIPFANMDFFKFLGGSFILTSGSNFLTNLFISPVFSDTTVIYSSIIMGSLIVVLHVVIYVIFKNRDIN